MNEPHRLLHVDGLRGLAVLLMVLVHAAATWEPNLTGSWIVFGVVVSAAGGLAAPLFVALLGWGLAQKHLALSSRFWRAGFLFFCQFLVNLSAPHLFEPWTPGVLSLMGVLMQLEPTWRTFQSQRKQLQQTFFVAFGTVCLFTILLQDWQGPSQWDSRVSTESLAVLVQHALITGLYPVFPWVAFAWFGSAVASIHDDAIRHRWLSRLSIAGLGVSFLILGSSVIEGRPWALPTGDASLTFFPANAAFLVAAITGLSLLWWCAERFSLIHRLADLGRVSLTVYVLHFLPFSVFHAYDEMHHWHPAFTGFVVVGYTTTWVVVGTWLHRRSSSFTLEAWMRRFEPT